MRTRSAAGGWAARYAVGETPYGTPKLVVNDPTLRRPTVKQMSATDRSVLRSSAAARSSRRVSRYWCGVSPKRAGLAAEMGGERRAGASERGHVERLCVAGVDEGPRAKQVSGGRGGDGAHLGLKYGP